MVSQLAPKAAALSAKVAPASNKFFAIPWPIRPDAPMYPTVISVFCFELKICRNQFFAAR
jgi:hypothetical protein